MKKLLVIFGSIFLVVIVVSVGLFHSFARGGYGEEYHRVWKCDDYDICINSYAEKFPDIPHEEKVSVDGDNYELAFVNERFKIGNTKNFEEDGLEYCEFISVIEGEYSKGWFDFTIHIDKVSDSKYNYLKDKTLVFHKE